MLVVLPLPVSSVSDDCTGLEEANSEFPVAKDSFSLFAKIVEWLPVGTTSDLENSEGSLVAKRSNASPNAPSSSSSLSLLK